MAILIYYRGANWRSGRLLIIYYCVTFFLMLAACGVLLNSFEQNVWLYNLTSVCTNLFIGVYFIGILRAPVKKKAVIILVSLNSLYALLKNVIFKEFYLFDSVGYSFVSASITVYVFMYFHQVLKNVTERSILKQFDFWLSAGYLIYFLGSFIIFLSYYHYTKQILAAFTKELQYLVNALWGVHNLLLFVSALSLLIGSIWLTYRKKSV